VSRRDEILIRAADLAGAFFYYDRKEDEDLPRGEIEAALAAGEITLDEIVREFAKNARQNGIEIPTTTPRVEVVRMTALDCMCEVRVDGVVTHRIEATVDSCDCAVLEIARVT
jgi:superfamily II RNA helicase